jgi:DNA-binding MarR family transcriptional regulator
MALKPKPGRSERWWRSRSELTLRGCYLGTNVSYNLRKLIDTGYVDYVKSPHDKRVTLVRNSDKGTRLCSHLQELNDKHQNSAGGLNIDSEDMLICAKTLINLQKYWGRALDRVRMSIGAVLAA